MTRQQLSRFRAFVHAKCGVDHPLRLRLTVAALLIAGAVWLFIVIAQNVMDGQPMTTVDLHVANWFYSNEAASLTRLVLLFTHLHSTSGLLLFTAIFALFLAWRKERYWVMSLALAVPGGMLLNVALKHIFQRARPVFEEPLMTLTTYSFPSGHASGSTLFYGVLAAYLISKLRGTGSRLMIVIAAVALVGMVGLSRMYLGVHYLSDVIAGVFVGVAWLAFSLAVAALWQRQQRRQPRKAHQD